ncbi:MAG: LnmK family bifunctional acyltransferase/decarboxylase [Candidatus Binatia bacterium]
MHRARTPLVLGMPHTGLGGLSEVALLSHANHLRWTQFGAVTGRPASRQHDAEGRDVYASVYFVDLGGLPAAGLGAYQSDDELEVVSTLGRFGRSMLDGEHYLYPAGTLPAELPAVLPPAPSVRLSNVLVGVGTGPNDLKVTTPSNAHVDAVPPLPEEPDSYTLIKTARAHGRFFDPPPDATPLWAGAREVRCPINPDRDLNGVGLLYFCNYVAFMDFAERVALEDAGGFPPESLDARVTTRRRIGFYGNATAHDTLAVDVEAHVLGRQPTRLLVTHRVRRASDERLIAVASVEKRLAG